MRLSEPYRLEHWQSGIGAACTAERMRLLFVLSRTSLFAGLAAVALVAVWLWPVAARGTLLAWIVLMAGNAAALAWMQRRFRLQRPSIEAAARWERWFALKTAVAGLLWGMAFWLLAPPSGELLQIFLVLTLSTVCLGASAVLCPSRLAYYAFMLPAVVPAAFTLLLGQSGGIAAAGWAVMIYIAVLVGVHDALHRNLVSTLRGRFESEALAAEHKVIIDSAAEAIGLLRPNYLAKCNRQWCALFGYRYEEALGQPVWAWWPSYEEWSQFAQACMAPISEGKPYHAVVQLRRKSGELFWAEISGMAIDPANLDLGVVWMGTDISERRRTDEALKASEQRFRDLLSLWTDWYWEIDREFRFTQVSGHAMDNSGYTDTQVLGLRRWELPFIRGVSEAQWQAHREALQSHAPFRDFTYQIVKPDGELRWFSVSGNPAYDEQGDFAGYFVTAGRPGFVLRDPYSNEPFARNLIPRSRWSPARSSP